jgi:hypothetical protein
MTTLRINGSERHVTRLFALDLPPEAVERFVTEAADTGEWPLRDALGATALQAGFVDVIAITDLGDMPLSRYLAEAHGVPETELAPMAGQLDALRGHVIALPAQTFARTSQVLRVSGPLRWIGTFGEEKPEAPGAPLQSDAASPDAGRKPVSDAAMSGRIATLALLVLFALVALVVWVAA